MKRILITGSCGFIGHHLKNHLIMQGNLVLGLDNLISSCAEPGLNDDIVDITIPFDQLLEKVPYEIDQIYHLACPASPKQYAKNPIETIRTCVTGTENILRLAKLRNASVVFTSTSEVYGDPLQHPQPESYLGNVNSFGPRSCYDEGKRCAEALCYYAKQDGVDVRIARLFNCYGPGMAPDDGRVVSNFIMQAINRNPLTIYGDGSQTRSFCYVTDTIDGLQKLMNVDKQLIKGPINIGNDHQSTIHRIARLIQTIFGYDDLQYQPLPQDDPQQRQPDITLAKTLLDWQPNVCLQDGLNYTIAWFIEHYKHLKV